MNKLLQIIEKMRSSKVANYVIAGLDSHLLENGNVRFFECSRNHQDQITPHSHRFDFACLVLAGEVTNRVWTECTEDAGDFFEESQLTYEGEIGRHSVKPLGRGFWSYEDGVYGEGEIYSMTADQIHSISFSKGAKVLFLEGPELSDTSIIIEPVVGGLKIPTYQKQDYMFITASD